METTNEQQRRMQIAKELYEAAREDESKPEPKGRTMRYLKSIKTWLAILVTVLLAGAIMNACSVDPTVPNDMAVEQPAVPQGPDGNPYPSTEIDNIPGVPEKGNIVKDVTNPITEARAYEEMEQDPNDPYGVLSRVIVEYKGKITKMQPSSAIIQFSPDGRYLLYIANSSPANQNGTYLYNFTTEKTQELAPSVLEKDPRYIPAPEFPTWHGNTITYEAKGKTWTLTYKEE